MTLYLKIVAAQQNTYIEVEVFKYCFRVFNLEETISVVLKPKKSCIELIKTLHSCIGPNKKTSLLFLYDEHLKIRFQDIDIINELNKRKSL